MLAFVFGCANVGRGADEVGGGARRPTFRVTVTSGFVANGVDSFAETPCAAGTFRVWRLVPWVRKR